MACCLGFCSDMLRPSVFAIATDPHSNRTATLSFRVTSKHGQTGWLVGWFDPMGTVTVFFIGGAIKFSTVPNLRWLFKTLRFAKTGMQALKYHDDEERERNGSTEWWWNRNQVFKREEEGLSEHWHCRRHLRSTWWTAVSNEEGPARGETANIWPVQIQPLTNIRKVDKYANEESREGATSEGWDHLPGELNTIPLASLSIVAGRGFR